LNSRAAETLSICALGNYIAPSGASVEITPLVTAAVNGTALYRPAYLEQMPVPGVAGAAPPAIEVTSDTTAEASRRLVEAGVPSVVALNFASARNVGGGFLNGAEAQEEDLCRASALYPCLERQLEYYDANRANHSALYTDHAIWSPEVPFFRGDDGKLLERPFTVSIITMPAPNRAEVRRDPEQLEALREAYRRRTVQVMKIAAHRGHRTLVLGAWGCGAFRNEPADAVDAFEAALRASAGAFERVVFAVFERKHDGPNRRAFSRLSTLA
jgi:uncharacterized protein (TIGR02452 family)